MNQKTRSARNKTRGNSWFRNDIGIDLGTANTLVYVPGKGVVINEPSVVAINTRTGRIVAVGTPARDMLGRTPAHIRAVRPLVEGVISDFEVAEEMIGYFLREARKHVRSFVAPRVLVGVPTGVTNVEIRAVRDAVKNAGARSIHIVEEPMAAAIGVGLPILSHEANMIVDIGGGTTDIAVITLGGLIASKNIRVAGDHFTADIIRYLKDKHTLLVGEKTAEDAKMKLCSMNEEKKPLEAPLRGRDLSTGLPKEITVTDEDVKFAVRGSITSLIETVESTLETLPPEAASDVLRRGVWLVGGGALIPGLETVLSAWMKVKFHVADDPLTAMARGTGVILEEFEKYESVLIHDEDIHVHEEEKK